MVLVRLVLNPYVLSYELGPTLIFNWLLYGYGVPAASFIVATRQFGSRKDDALIAVLEAGSSLLLLLLLSFELTHAIYGRLTLAPADDFASGSALTALWFVYAAALLALGEYKQRPVLRWGGLILLIAVTPVLVGWQFLSLIFGARVGKLPVLDALFLADAVPALVFAAIAWRAEAYPVWRWIARLLAATFAFWWMTLEVQHWFHPGSSCSKAAPTPSGTPIRSCGWSLPRHCWAPGCGAAASGCAAPDCSASHWSSPRCFYRTWRNWKACCAPSPSWVSAPPWSASATPTAASAQR